MEFSIKELAVLNHMISVALLSGQVEFNEVTKSVYGKIAGEIVKMQEKGEKNHEDSN